MSNHLYIPIIGCTLFSAAVVFGWSVSGTVVSSKGGAIEGAAVTVADSANYSTATDAAGAFSLKSAEPLSIHSAEIEKDGFALSVRGGILSLRGAYVGKVRFSLSDASGKVYWNREVMKSGGDVSFSLPKEYNSRVSFLRFSKLDGETYTYKGTVGGAFFLANVSFPQLKFHKAGYQDTTFSMTSAMQTGVSVVMRDTATEKVTCPAQALAAGDYNKTISVKGVSRSYILHVPSAYKGDSAATLVVDFHPIGGSASGEFSSSPYKAVTDPEGVITVYPNGLASPNMGQAWNVGPCCTTADDTSFARAVVAEVKTLACINPKRVYAVGFSMGGGMTHYSACHLADVFAAFSPASFDLATENIGACAPSRPVPIIMFRGTSDLVVPYAGGYSSFVSGMPITFLGAKATFAKWAELDKCTGSPSAEDANGCSTYSTCSAGVKVTLCSINGGGHDYGKANIGWPWLKNYTMP